MVTKHTVKIVTVGQLEIGQASYLLNHPRNSINIVHQVQYHIDLIKITTVQQVNVQE